MVAVSQLEAGLGEANVDHCIILAGDFGVIDYVCC